jgi:hypothetical protein
MRHNSGMDLSNHTLAVLAATTDPIYQPSLESDSDGSAEVYMVGNGEELLDKSVNVIQRETNVELARATRLAREAERGKRQNSLQDDSSASKDEPRDGTPMRRHHSMFN